MPIYEYQCTQCHKVFEEWVKQIGDGADTLPCAHCGKTARRIVSQTSFALKGDGWYVTEYGSKKKAKADAAPGNAATSDAATGDASANSAASSDAATSQTAPSASSPNHSAPAT